MKLNIKSEYLHKIYSNKQFIKTIDIAYKKIRAFKKKNNFDVIAFTGSSGAALAYPLSYKLKIPLICIRKDKSSHFKEKIEGQFEFKNYIIVDDFISSGATIKKIMREIDYHCFCSIYHNSGIPKCVGIYLYDDKNKKHKYLNISKINNLK